MNEENNKLIENIVGTANRNLGWNSEIKKGDKVTYYPSWINTIGTVIAPSGRKMIVSLNCIDYEVR